MKPMTRSAAFALLATAACLAHATEGGGSTYPRGVENFLVGAVPPPGVYLLGYGNHYAADKFIDGQGDNAGIPGFKVRATAAVLRGVWSTKTNVMGGNLVFHAIAPLVNLKVSAAGNSQNKSGLGDITVGTGVAFHHSPQLHTVVGLDLSLPTGDYDKNNLANIGRNYLSVQPLFGVSRIDPNGLNADLKLTLNINRRNKATDYRSGNELFADYSVGWGLGNGWTVGVGGHAWQQLANDQSGGADVDNSKSRAFALGPSLKYDNGKGWFFTAKLQRDMAVRNSTQGTAFWLKTSIPF